jgi:tol-pal system protein YbgF
MQYLRRDINTLQGQIDALRKDITSTRPLPTPQPTTAIDDRREQADMEAELVNMKQDLSSLRATIEDNQSFTAKISSRLDQLDQAFTARLNELEARSDETVKGTAGLQPEPQLVSPEPEVKTTLPTEAEGQAELEVSSTTGSSVAEKAYNEAYRSFQTGDLDLAKDRFVSFLRQYPDTPLSDNAQFWIGEISFKKHQYEAAILAYEDVIKKYPDSNKLPDAMLKQALAFQELGDKIDARIILENLVKRYPQTEQAKIARDRLKTLK